MTHPRVFIFSPTDRAKAVESYRILEAAGCELVYGKESWRTPRDSNEDETRAMAKGADVSLDAQPETPPLRAES